ncbi:hypothetical protein GCM10022235_30180 [Kribbella ginsengisoli]|uniref:Uncharacterized protein n=1 Tax=Kribbella ginsengisoli TaxID=363865 RepID=A0ABP6X1N6_9ACTN
MAAISVISTPERSKGDARRGFRVNGTDRYLTAAWKDPPALRGVRLVGLGARDWAPAVRYIAGRGLFVTAPAAGVHGGASVGFGGFR